MIFRALRHRNFFLFFIGQGVSLIGTWMQQVAEVWLMYRLTHSAIYLGIMAFANQIPGFVLAPFAGVWIDRMDRRRLLLVTQILAMILSFAVAALVFLDRITVVQLIVLGALGGMVDAFDIPARQSFVSEMVDDRDDLGNAIALNSSLVNGARLIGPSIAGLLIAAVGEGWCFFINGLTFLTVIAALVAMRVPNRKTHQAVPAFWANLREGFRYALGFTPIWAMLGLLALVSLMGTPYSTLMPIFATSILHGGPQTVGFLMAASGLGAFAAALSLANRRSVLGLGKWIPYGMGSFGVCLCLFSLSHAFWLSWIILLGSGFGMMTGIASTNTMLQTIVDEDKRGRVMSFFTMAFFGMTPVGSLIQGRMAARFGAPHTVLFGGLTCIAGAAAFLTQLPRLRREIRPIYRRLGILPEVAAGLQVTTAERTLMKN